MFNAAHLKLVKMNPFERDARSRKLAKKALIFVLNPLPQSQPEIKIEPVALCFLATSLAFRHQLRRSLFDQTLNYDRVLHLSGIW